MKLRTLLYFALLSLATPAFCGEAISRPERITPRFIDVPLESLAEAVGTATGKTFVIEPGLHVSITLTSDRPLSGDELYAEFQFALNKQGLGTFQRGGYILIQAMSKSRLIRV